jgi:AraC-like DNA-binding protein
MLGEEKLMRRLCETAGLGLVRHTGSVIAATSGAMAIGDLRVAAGVSSTHLTQRFKELIGVPPKRLARTYRFAATVFSINPARPIGWGDLAGDAGYFDQAHFGHEFRTFTGLTPTVQRLGSRNGTKPLLVPPLPCGSWKWRRAFYRISAVRNVAR